MSIQAVLSARVPEGFTPYQELSRLAVVSPLFALLSGLGILFPSLLSLALLAAVCALLALRAIRRHPEELAGRWWAYAGLAMGLVMLSGGTALHAYSYVTEIREGYQRVTWYDLKPGEPTLKLDPNNPYVLKPSALALSGQKVFIKGYVHPNVSKQADIKRFVLVPDMGTCCFGGQPKLTDMIEVNVTGDVGVNYSFRLRKLHGVFKIAPKPDPQMLGAVYQLEAEIVE